MKTNFLLILFMVSLSANPVHAEFGRDTTIVRDINGDGFRDSLSLVFDSGSGFGGSFITVLDGKTNEIQEWNEGWCFCEIFSTQLIPPFFLKKENEKYLALVDFLLERKQGKPDAGFNWIVDARMHTQWLKNSEYLDQVISVGVKWNPLPVDIPDEWIYVRMRGDSLHKIYATTTEKPAWYDSSTNVAWVGYGSSNQVSDYMQAKWPVKGASQNGIQLLLARHGVIAKKNNAWAWMFISDYETTGGVDKLRWESIRNVFFAGGLIFVLQNIETGLYQQIFVIDPETGVCGHLKTEPFLANEGTAFLEQDGKLICTQEYFDNRADGIDLKKLKAELKRFKQ